MWAEETLGSLAPCAAAGEVPDPAASVLVVSENPRWREELASALETEGYRVYFAPPARADLDVAVVHLSNAGRVPDPNIGALRARSEMPIMVVTAVAVGEATVLGAYTAGADQCVNGFARPRELVARVRALLRRNPPRSRVGGEVAAALGISVDVARCTAVVAGVDVELTLRECEILDALIRRPGRVVRRDELVAAGLYAGALDSHVRGLRNKLEAVDCRRRIVVVRGVGFRFDAS